MEHRNIKSFVFLSALSLGIPAIVSLFTTPVPYAVVLISATIWSSLYHYYSESNYESMDTIWANLASLFALGYFILVIGMYGWLSWRTLLPLIFSLISLLIFFLHGHVPSNGEAHDIKNYDLYHGLWHCFSTLTALTLVISPVKHSELYRSVWSLVT